jgi:membrane protease YdiL (CAAX protease family)
MYRLGPAARVWQDASMALSPSTMWWRALELALAFGAIPAAMKLRWLPRNPIPILLLGGALCLWVLLSDPTFDRAQLWNGRNFLVHLRAVLLALLVGAPALYGLMRWLAPDDAFALLRQRPLLWGIVMLAYPLVSVYPQELIYRAFFFHRYGALFGHSPWLCIFASAIAFAIGHVFFSAPRVVLPLTFVGGLLFAHRYAQTRSLLVASVEHALYGDLIFTVGLGRYFFHAAERLSSRG